MYSNKNTMINITYAITVCNELEEITKLIDFLKDKIEKEDEILIQYDEVSVTTAVKNYLTIISQLHNTNIRVIGFPLNNDFASFKNNLKDNATGIFIFQIDADEIPSEDLMENIKDIIEYNKFLILFSFIFMDLFVLNLYLLNTLLLIQESQYFYCLHLLRL